MSDAGIESGALIYGLDDRPAPPAAALAAVQHILASIVGIVTPTLVIGGVLGLGGEIPYLIAMSLFVSGVATFIQCRRIGPVGSGGSHVRDLFEWSTAVIQINTKHFHLIIIK